MSTMPGNPYAGPSPKGDARTQATLALAFEQRTANLIALHHFGMGLYLDGRVTDSSVDYLENMNRMCDQIEERLGLDGDDQ